MNNADDFGPSHVSLFPMPPFQLINKYSDSAIAQDLAPPPPPPIEGQPFRMFEGVCNTDDPILRNLEFHNIKRVYPQVYNRRRELRKLNFSLLANFLDLLDILTKDPQSIKRTEKLEHMEVLFINMHHLVNEFRPHQARDLLREILNYQVKISDDTTERAKEYYDKSTSILKETAIGLSKNYQKFSLEFTDLDLDLRSMLLKLKNTENWDKLDAASTNVLNIKQSESQNCFKLKESNQSDVDPELWKYLTTETVDMPSPNN